MSTLHSPLMVKQYKACFRRKTDALLASEKSSLSSAVWAAENEPLGLTDDEIGEPSGHWRSQVQIFPNGDGILNTDDILDIEEHPDLDKSESKWRKWAIGNRGDSEDED